MPPGTPRTRFLFHVCGLGVSKNLTLLRQLEEHATGAARRSPLMSQ